MMWDVWLLKIPQQSPDDYYTAKQNIIYTTLNIADLKTFCRLLGKHQSGRYLMRISIFILCSETSAVNQRLFYKWPPSS